MLLKFMKKVKYKDNDDDVMLTTMKGEMGIMEVVIMVTMMTIK